MTRASKEKARIYREATKDMNEDDKKNYDLLLELQNRFDSLWRKLHCELFQEEYDFMYDEIVDAKRRQRGENPMSKEYIEKMDKKRESLGFLPLKPNGEREKTDNTIEYCKKLITKELDYKAMYLKEK
ncbi:MAG: Unknown protein [uncultured Sulfurovum sp.]|uniref:Uncharacterized protein n=1 Tax=uncultured Sulfurovum sp. TaxID=269237 RepID=A0A6S6SC28_9BACT|nr:MAG: Unknown protein [uncultured Sulfurovum sp.]